MTAEEKRIPVAFYRTDIGDRRIGGNDLQTLEYGWPVGMPLCRAMRSHKGLWEVRSNLSSGRIARILFCVAGGRMVLLHAFIKKTQKTPEREIALAEQRKRDHRHRRKQS